MPTVIRRRLNDFVVLALNKRSGKRWQKLGANNIKIHGKSGLMEVGREEGRVVGT